MNRTAVPSCDAAKLPRYAEIRRELEHAILSGRWPPGRRVPSEHDLVAWYGCARMTVNKALSELAAAGLIVRHRRAGSFVAVPANDQSILEIHDIEAEARSDGKAYRFELLGRALRKATRADAARLGVKPGAPVLALASVHFVDGAPFAAEDRLINLDAVPRARDIDFTTRTPGGWLLAQIPWSRARHRISAINADAAMARALRIARGAACLVVSRETWQQEVPITQVDLSHSGESHHLVAHFSPAGRRRDGSGKHRQP
ncbi:MAG: histidine utilization repressor [Xanthobacteraceae bacterium]|nr:histidine utilization repressor [Xanthobacteraceae bacterium]